MAPKHRMDQLEKPNLGDPLEGLPSSSDDGDNVERDSFRMDCHLEHQPPLVSKNSSASGEPWLDKVVRVFKEWSQNEGIRTKAKWSAAALAVAILTSATLRKNYRHSERPKRSALSLWLVKLFQQPEYLSKAVLTVSFSMLQAAAKEGRIQKALVGSHEIVYQDHKGSWKRSKLPPGSPSLQKDMLSLLSNGGCADISALPETLTSKLASRLLLALPFIYLALVYRMMKNLHGGNDMPLQQGDKDAKTTFADVAGLDTIMPEVREIVNFLRHTRIYRHLGAKPPQGILLHGPPGSGKTLLARAVAGEADAAFLACSGSEFCEMFVGRGAARVRSLFQQARTLARQRSHGNALQQLARKLMPSTRWTDDVPPPTTIIFIDEFDALAKSRSYGAMHGNDEREATLNQLLTEMDGFASGAQGDVDSVCIIVIAATNRPDSLDPAILRRFDRQLHVPYPDARGRRDILKIHARSTNCHISSIEWDVLASDDRTGNFSGSDLRNLVNDAALLAVRSGSSHVKQTHLEQAIRRAQAMKSQSDLTSHSNFSLGPSKSGGPQFVFFPNGHLPNR